MNSIRKISVKKIIKMIDSVEDKDINIDKYKYDSIKFYNVDASKYDEGINKICEIWYYEGRLHFENGDISFEILNFRNKKFGMLYNYLCDLRTYMMFQYNTERVKNFFIGSYI